MQSEPIYFSDTLSGEMLYFNYHEADGDTDHLGTLVSFNPSLDIFDVVLQVTTPSGYLNDFGAERQQKLIQEISLRSFIVSEPSLGGRGI